MPYTQINRSENIKGLVSLAEFSMESRELVKPAILSLSPCMTVSYFIDNSF